MERPKLSIETGPVEDPAPGELIEDIKRNIQKIEPTPIEVLGNLVVWHAIGAAATGVLPGTEAAVFEIIVGTTQYADRASDESMRRAA